MTPPPRRGMTLIELIMALTIGSMVIASVLAVLSSATRTQDLGERRADLLQCVRVSLEQIQKDLQLAVTRANDEQFTFLGTDSGESELPMDSIEFTSASGDPLSSLLPTGDLVRVQLYIETDEKATQTGLLRSAIRLPLPEEVSPTEAELSTRTYCPMAVGLDLAYYDPTEEDWIEEWQERTDLPTAVRVVLYALTEPPEEGAEPDLRDVTTFSTVVQLMLADAALGIGQPSAEEGGGGATTGLGGEGQPGTGLPTEGLPNVPGLEGLPGLTGEGGER